MKKVILWLSVSVFSIFTYVTFLCSSNSVFQDEGPLSLISLTNIESLAQAELPEVEIVCGSSENKGPCWRGDCVIVWTPFGFYHAWDCNKATGSKSDVCVQDVRC